MKKFRTKCTECFKVLGVDSRMRIYAYLKQNGEASVSEIVEIIRLKQPTISYHLKEMKEKGLVDNKKVGKEVYYDINEMCPYRTAKCVIAGVEIPVF